MDPLSALSLAGTIVQFVDFTSKMLSDSRQLYQSTSGFLDAHEQIELVTADLRSVVAKLQGFWSLASGEPSGPLTEKDQSQDSSFCKICDETTRIAEELL